MNGPKEINIKNRTHYPFDDMVNTMDNDPDKIRIGKKSYNIGYVHCRNIRYINPLCTLLLIK